MLFFLVCADEANGATECLARGWTQVGFARFFTPSRDDVRVVRRFTDIALLPGGTWLMAGPDYMQNSERDAFDNLVSAGVARWVTGEEPKVVELKIDMPSGVAALESETRQAMMEATVFNPVLPALSPTRDAWPPRNTPPLLTGGHRGPRPSRR